jgi:hypothetical protein
MNRGTRKMVGRSLEGLRRETSLTEAFKKALQKGNEKKVKAS